MIALLILAASAPQFNCANQQTQAEMNWCAYQEYRRADDAMNVQWQATLARMKVLDRDLDRKSDKEPGSADTLLSAQRAWLTYRDQHCLSESFGARGGSMAPMLLGWCKAVLTRQRTKQLGALAKVEH